MSSDRYSQIARREAERRAGYDAACVDLLAHIECLRADTTTPPTDVTPEACKASGQWFGRVETLDALKAWALSARETP